MNAQKAIEQLGYKPAEVRVYLTLLRVGESTASYIADRVKLPRTSVQVTLEKLHKQDLVSFYTKKRYKYWIAESPEKLAAIIKERETILKQVLPELQALQRTRGDKPLIKIFIGAHEIKHMQQDMIGSKHHICGILSWTEWMELFGKEYVTDLIEMRIKYFLHIRLLSPISPLAKQLRAMDQKQLRETKFLPNRITLNTSTFIYGNKVAIISLNKRQPTGILIEDVDINFMMQELFEEIWRIST